MLLLKPSLLAAASRKPVSNIFQRTKDGRILRIPGTTVPGLESADGTPRSPYPYPLCPLYRRRRRLTNERTRSQAPTRPVTPHRPAIGINAPHMCTPCVKPHTRWRSSAPPARAAEGRSAHNREAFVRHGAVRAASPAASAIDALGGHRAILRAASGGAVSAGIESFAPTLTSWTDADPRNHGAGRRPRFSCARCGGNSGTLKAGRTRSAC
jgi:hypothetical protein